MDDLEFFTPLDSRLDREFKSTTTLESGTNLSSLSFNNRSSIRSNESASEEDGHLYKVNKDVLVPNGFNSILFLPLVDAVFKPTNLKKELVIKMDLQELAKALLVALSSVENAFTVLGNHVKGLCLLLSHQIRFLSSDFVLYSKRVVGTDLALANKLEASRYYESDDETVQKTKRKQRKRKIKDTDSVTTIQDYGAKYHGELVPIERLEILRVMNLGLSGNELFFMNNEVSPVLKDYLKEMNVSNKVSGEKDWLSFDDLRMLSSPFKLNGYSFTPNMDNATVAATSEMSYSTTYDIDWSLRNDPLNYKSSYYENYNSYFGDDGMYDANDNKVLALEDDKVRKKRKSATLRLFDVDLVRTEIKYDRKPNKYKPKRKVIEKRKPGIQDNKSDKVQKNRALALVQPPVDIKQVTLNQMFDKYFSSLVNDATNVDSQLSGVGDINSSSGAINIDTINRANIADINTNNIYSQNTDNYKDSQVQWTGKERTTHIGHDHRDKSADAPLKKDMVEKEVIGEAKGDRVYETTFQDTADGFGTIDVLNWLRETFRKSDFNSIKFDRLTKGLKAGKASVVFLRVLILANSNFVAVSQDSEVITIAPGERFWEPVNTRLSIPVGS